MYLDLNPTAFHDQAGSDHVCLTAMADMYAGCHELSHGMQRAQYQLAHDHEQSTAL